MLDSRSSKSAGWFSITMLATVFGCGAGTEAKPVDAGGTAGVSAGAAADGGGVDAGELADAGAAGTGAGTGGSNVVDAGGDASIPAAPVNSVIGVHSGACQAQAILDQLVGFTGKSEIVNDDSRTCP